MARVTEHLDWAEENERTAQRLDKSNPNQAAWAITIVFYAALHYVDAYVLAHFRSRPVDHAERDDIVRSDDSELKTIAVSYRRLKDMSRQARYQLAHYSEREYQAAVEHLRTVRNFVVIDLNRRKQSL